MTNLTDHRPTSADIATLWGESARTMALVRLQTDAGRPALAEATPVTMRASRTRRTRTRWVTALGLASAAAVALAVVPSLVSSTVAPPASASERLARTARTVAPLDIPTGKFLHLVTESSQTGGTAMAQPSGDTSGTTTPASVERRRSQGWTAEDGTIWRVDTTTVGGQRHREVFRFDPPTSMPGLDGTPRGLTRWPTTAAALDAFLRSSLTAKPGVEADHQVFATLDDILYLPYAPSALRAAAIEVVAKLPESTVRDEGSRTTIAFADPGNPGSVDTLVFDEGSARVVERRTTAHSFAYQERLVSADIVAAVPQDILAGAIPQG